MLLLQLSHLTCEHQRQHLSQPPLCGYGLMSLHGDSETGLVELRILGGGAIRRWIPWVRFELLWSVGHGPGCGATGSSCGNQDLAPGCVWQALMP
jgi:hypothetical protein